MPSPKDPEVAVRTTVRLTVALGVCAMTIGLTGCTGDADPSPDADATMSEAPSAEATATEAPDPETTTSEAPAAETTETPDDGDGTDPRMEALTGAWTEDVPMMGSSFTVASDGFVFLTGEGGSFEGTIVLGDADRHRLELVSNAGGSPPATMHWELEYDAATDTILVFDTRDDGTVHEREFVRDA